MGYWLHKPDADPTSGENYPTMQSARIASESRDGWIVTFQLTQQENDAWRDRESARFTSGEYIRVPWRSTQFDHYVHLSLTRPGLVAYTQTPEHGFLDRQTAVRPGRYLTEYYTDVYDETSRARLIAECAITTNPPALCFARTPDDIETVYTGGPQSCMSHMGLSRPGCKHSDCNGPYRRSTSCRAYSGNVHPTRVYGNSDLSVAYIGPIDHVSARCVVWESRKLYSRIYGSDLVLDALLRLAGFVPGSLAGARIRRIPYHGGFIMPYIDGASGADDTGRLWLRLTDGDGDLSVTTTSGVIDVPPVYECSHCGQEYDYDENDGHSDYCPSCVDTMWSCVECGADYFDDQSFEETRDGGCLCESCSDALRQTCQTADCDETWIELVEFTWRERRDRRDRRLSDYCPECCGFGGRHETT